MDGALTDRVAGTMTDMRAYLTFLDLLVREAAAVEFEGPVLEARAAGLPPEELELLERAKVTALTVRALLEHRRRREAELSALFDTAGDLAGLRDLDSVLQAIVHRARQLLSADIAYLSMNDPDAGDTYMRVTDGSVSARFQQLRLPMGAGLGGLVAQRATPYATPNYFADERFRHTREIDSAVTEEGLVSILGVPLVLGSRVIGVLYAANRTEKPFSRDDITLLVSLAAHVAVAIDKTRLLDETRAAVRELSATSELLRAHVQSVERAADVHDRLTGVVLRGGGVEDVAAAVTEVLGGSLLVVDEERRRLAEVGSGPPPGDETVEAATAAAVASGRATHVDGVWAAPVVAGTEHLGCLVLLGHPELSDADRRILERAALVTAVLRLFQRSAAEAEERVRGELLDDLLRRPERDPQGLRERAQRLRTDLDREQVVVVVGVDGVARQRLAFAAASLATSRGGLSVVHDGSAVLLLPGTDPGSVAREVAQLLGASLGRPVTVGGAGPAKGPLAVRPAYDQAAHALAALRALGREGHGAGVEELGFVGLLLGDARDVDGFVQRTLGPVLDYDARRGTDLVATLAAYFAAGCNLARTKDSLHVHVNTVTQRLDRVGQLLGADWAEPENALDVQLALRLLRLRNTN